MQIVNIDIKPNKVKPIVELSQYDDNALVRFALFDNGEEYTLAGTETVEVDIRKPDGNIVTIEPTIAAASYIDVYFTQQACACYGDSFGEIRLKTDSYDIGTCNFILRVEISPTFGGIESASEIANLSTQIEELAEDVTTEVVNEIAPDIIAEIAPSVIGNEYYTKAEVQENYYNKTFIDNNYVNNDNLFNLLNKIYPATLTAGETTISFTIFPLFNNMPNYVQFFINEPNIEEPTYSVTQGTGGKEIVTLTFDSAFDHDVVISALQFGIGSIYQ